jgi:hypothetical protein
MSTIHTHHSAGTCRAAKHARVQHLITADEHPLAELEALIARSPTPVGSARSPSPPG